MSKKPYVLIIIDGIGVDVPSGSNAVALADKYNLDSYVSKYFATTLYASSEFVGLPFGAPGDSEIGHLNIGAGKIVYQDLLKINKAIKDKSFFLNEYFLEAILLAKKKKKKLHLIGTLSYSAVNSLIEHLYSLIELIKSEELDNFYLHIILDGKDSDNNSGVHIVRELQEKLNVLGIGKIASISGRSYGMDRDYNWDKTKMAYDAIVNGESSEYTNDAIEYINKSYESNLFDDKMIPAVIVGKNNKPVAIIDDDDSVIFFNFKADRIRQLAKSIITEDFDKFEIDEENQSSVKKLKDVYFVTMTEYENELTDHVAFVNESVNESLTSLISDAKLLQLHIAETEKYSHVTYFLNGQKDLVYQGEYRVLVPSVNYKNNKDSKPEMNLFKLVSIVVDSINEEKYDFIVCNFCNAEVMAHEGNIKKTIKAVQHIDREIGEVVDATLNHEGVVFITSDHGNAEKMVDNGEPHKNHTSNPVPFIIVGKDFENKKIVANFNMLNSEDPEGVLADIAPTILKIMGIEKGVEMKGKELI